MKKVIEWTKNNKFQSVVIILLIVLFVFMTVKENNRLFLSENNNTVVQQNNNSISKNIEQPKTVIIFTQPLCRSCQQLKSYIDDVLKAKYPEITFKSYNVTQQKEKILLDKYFEKYNLNINDFATPTVFLGEDYLIGYESNEKSGKQLEKLIEKNFYDKQFVREDQGIEQGGQKSQETVKTWFGSINVFEKSLPVLAITLGLVDGFNPCAMWVLAYLISLIIGLNDKRKIWLIVGSFVLASGVLYYLFMTALLNVFLYIGFIRILELLVGCAALYIGIMDLKVFFFDKGLVMCNVGDAESKQKTMTRAQKLVNAEISLATILGVIGLAFVVNSMEFVCSAALPAIFTKVLAQADLSMLAYHFYIFLYVFFFMLDDLIIFGLAALTVDKFIGNKYVVYCKLIGGIILTVLGVLMLFAPQYLR